MSEDQLRRIFAEGKPDWLEERPKSFEHMDRDDRIRACYQHCVLTVASFL